MKYVPIILMLLCSAAAQDQIPPFPPVVSEQGPPQVAQTIAAPKTLWLTWSNTPTNNFGFAITIVQGTTNLRDWTEVVRLPCSPVITVGVPNNGKYQLFRIVNKLYDFRIVNKLYE